MNMGQNLEMRMQLGLHLEQRLIMIQQQARFMKKRIQLLAAVKEERYDPYAVCPQCTYRLTIEDILKGFTRDPNDITTQCPKKRCKHRFIAALRNVSMSGASTVDVSFFCSAQTLARLPKVVEWRPEIIRKEEPALYHSATVHFGSLATAFQRINLRYQFKEEMKGEWRKKLRPFLGCLSDRAIARVIGFSPSTIRRERLRYKVQSFSSR